MSQLLVYSNATKGMPSEDNPWLQVCLSYPTILLNRKLIDASGVKNKHTVFNFDTGIVMERSEHEFLLSIMIFGFGLAIMRQWGY